MQGLDLDDTYQLYQQLLSGEAHLGAGAGAQEGAAAAAFFQPPPPPHPQAPMQGGGADQWVIDPADYVAIDGFSLLPQPPQVVPGGGVWAGDGAGLVPGGGDWAGTGGGFAQGEPWAAAGAGEAPEGSLMLGGDVFPGNDQSAHGGGGVPGAQDMLMDGVDLSKFMSDEAVDSLWASVMMDSLAANQAAAHPSIYGSPPMVPAAEPNQPASDSSGPSTQVAAADTPAMMSQMPTFPSVIDHQQHPPVSVDTPQAVPDDEEAQVAQMIRVAARCDDRASTVWSKEENQLLRKGLSLFAGQDNVNRCFSIAYELANKTVLDVAYRIRWLSELEKKRAAKQAHLEQEKSAEANVTKGKGTKGATRKNNRYPLSKEVLNSKSAKELIRDNDMLMHKIEENLRTGQVKDIPDYFYYVKMNMDALPNKVTDLATVMGGFSVDDEEWEDVLKDRSSSA